MIQPLIDTKQTELTVKKPGQNGQHGIAQITVGTRTYSMLVGCNLVNLQYAPV